MVKATEVTKKPKHIWLLAFGILLLLIGFGYKAYVWYQLRSDKQRFTEASVLVDKIYSDIVTELGQPEDSKRTNSCSRPYQEFTGYGDPVCRVGVTVIYSVNDRSVANNYLSTTQRIIASNRRISLNGTLSRSIQDAIAINTEYHAATDNYYLNGLNCTSNYVFDTPSETFLKIKNDSNKPFQISFGCSGEAKSQIYSTVQQ